MRRLLPLILLLASLLLPALGGESVSEALRYQRDLIAAEPWRLLTAHWVHLGWSHLLLNAVGLLLVSLLVGDAFRPAVWASLLLLSPLAISLGLFLLDPGLSWYVGFSGVLHSLIVAGALAHLGREPQVMGPLLLLVGGKLLWEQLVGPLPGSEQGAGGPVVVDAHLYGALVALPWYLTYRLFWRGVRIGRAG